LLIQIRLFILSAFNLDVHEKIKIQLKMINILMSLKQYEWAKNFLYEMVNSETGSFISKDQNLIEKISNAIQ